TLDGANIEIRMEVGAENFFLFGLTTPQVKALKKAGYSPWDYYSTNSRLQEAIDLVASGFFSHGNVELFRPLIASLLNDDPYCVLADFQSYSDCQVLVGEAYRNRDKWTRMSILNSARMGKFSSDRSVRDYCQSIWKVAPMTIDLDEFNTALGVTFS
ncbi:MAG: glycogen/starch/alpha-glucan phosphorylase, partial [Cyanobacteria bacterium P01_G01_bin.4]